MTTNQEEQLSSDKLVVKTAEENPDSIKLIPAFEAAIQKLKLIIGEVEKLRMLQDKDISGVTEHKHFTIDQLNERTLEVSGATFAYAEDQGDTVLKKLVDVKKDELNHKTPGEIVSVANTILTEAKKVVAADLTKHGISPAELKEFEDMVTYFNGISESPRESIIDRSGATKRIGELFKQSSALRKNTLDKLARQFKRKDPAYYLKYKGSRKIIHHGGNTAATPDTTAKT